MQKFGTILLSYLLFMNHVAYSMSMSEVDLVFLFNKDRVSFSKMAEKLTLSRYKSSEDVLYWKGQMTKTPLSKITAKLEADKNKIIIKIDGQKIELSDFNNRGKSLSINGSKFNLVDGESLQKVTERIVESLNASPMKVSYSLISLFINDAHAWVEVVAIGVLIVLPIAIGLLIINGIENELDDGVKACDSGDYHSVNKIFENLQVEYKVDPSEVWGKNCELWADYSGQDGGPNREKRLNYCSKMNKLINCLDAKTRSGINDSDRGIPVEKGFEMNPFAPPRKGAVYQ